METRQELKEIINELKDRLKEAQNKLENLDKNERFKPEENEEYFYVDSDNSIGTTNFDNSFAFDVKTYEAFNCFKTKEEAQKEANKILIRRKLEDLARRLNGDKKIDWNNEEQCKYFISYSFPKLNLYTNWSEFTCVQGTIYCLSNKFLDEARKEIGEKELVNYITKD